MLIRIHMSDETPYNNRQIERMLDNQSTDLKQHFDETIEPLAEQVGQTNGRVKSLELKNAEQAGFNRAIARSATAGFTVLVGLIGWLLLQQANIDQRIQKDTVAEIQQALLPYSK